METTTAVGRTWDYSHAIGGNRFVDPTAIDMKDGVIYVVNRAADTPPGSPPHRFVELQNIGMARYEDQEYLGNFGAHEFVWPVDLAIDAEGHVYVTDEHSNYVAVHGSDGKRLQTWGEPGTDPGKLSGPTGIAFDADQNVYVVESMNNRVQRFSKDGDYQLGWGSHGDGEGQFDRPWGVVVDKDGGVYVSDWNNNRVQKFTAEGEHLLTFGGSNKQYYKAPTWSYPDASDDFAGSLNHPSNCAIDSEGDVYVADWGNRRVQIYAPDGTFLTTLWGDANGLSRWQQEMMDASPDAVKAWRRAAPEMKAFAPQFHRPIDIYIDEEDRILVVETNRFRIQVYQKMKDYVEAQLNL